MRKIWPDHYFYCSPLKNYVYIFHCSTPFFHVQLSLLFILLFLSVSANYFLLFLMFLNEYSHYSGYISSPTVLAPHLSVSLLSFLFLYRLFLTFSFNNTLLSPFRPVIVKPNGYLKKKLHFFKVEFMLLLDLRAAK